MKKIVISAFCLSAFYLLLTNAIVFGQTNYSSFRSDSSKSLWVTDFNFPKAKILNDVVSIAPSNPHTVSPKFSNPVSFRFENGCSTDNINHKKFDSSVSIEEKLRFCKALQKVAFELNNNVWSENLGTELLEVWDVFLNQNVKIRRMKKNISKRIAAAAESFTENKDGLGFNASLYLRPESTEQNSFFLVAMHELRHVYDYYQLWENQDRITQAEFEKRGFRIMGKIAQETSYKESFLRLPNLWSEDWRNLSYDKISEKREKNIVSFMQKSRFYKHLLKNQNSYFISFSPKKENTLKTTANKEGNDERLPYLVKLKLSENKIEQNVKEISFTPTKPKNNKNSNELLQAALLNEKNLYYKMDNFVYDQSLFLQCWKKQKVVESLSQKVQIARTETGKTLLQFEDISISSKERNKVPSCVLNFDSIKTDVTETFWSAPYLEDLKIKFDYYTELNGTPVARYTVFKPSEQEFETIAEKYKFIKPFRVFFGTIFVSVEDSQIIKFWGSSFPQSQTTGIDSNKIHGSYNATAVRQKLTSGIWVTTKIDTVAVTYEKGKMKPFNYIVKYQNYRQGETDVLILDDILAESD